MKRKKALNMKFGLLRRLEIVVAFALLIRTMPCKAERGYVLVQVQDAQGHSVRGIEIKIEGMGDSGTTGDDGEAKLSVGSATKEGDFISLAILHSPSGKDYVMNSPWDSRTAVPSFENKADNFIKVVVVQRGDRAALENGTVLISLTEKINRANAPKTADKQAEQLDPKKNLEEVAKQYGLSPDEVDSAIRKWAITTNDPYEAGIAALFIRNYPKESTELEKSLQSREAKLITDQQAVAEDQKQVADAAFFLGLSLYGQGKYRDSAAAFERALKTRPDDATVLNNAALSLKEAGDYAAAEPLSRRAIAIDEKTLGPDHPNLAADLNNLGQTLKAIGNYTDAEALYRRALTIDEKALGPDHPIVASILGNLAVLLKTKGDFVGAEPLMRRVLDIDEKTFGADSAVVAVALNNLAKLFEARGDYSSAEPLMRRALKINENIFGSDHPSVAASLHNLAELLRAERDYSDAEPLYRRALAIDEKVLGPDHPNVASNLNGLAELLKAKGDYVQAEPLCRRALAIDKKAFGPEHPQVANNLVNLAEILRMQGNYVEADPMMRQALAIDENMLGPESPDVAYTLNSYGMLLGAC